MNTFSRIELMKEKTRALSAYLSANAKQPFEATHQMCDKFDVLAIDWVHSEALDWDGSMVDKYAKKIVEAVGQ